MNKKIQKRIKDYPLIKKVIILSALIGLGTISYVGINYKDLKEKRRQIGFNKEIVNTCLKRYDTNGVTGLQRKEAEKLLFKATGWKHTVYESKKVTVYPREGKIEIQGPITTFEVSSNGQEYIVPNDSITLNVSQLEKALE